MRVEKPGAVRFAGSVGVEIERSHDDQPHNMYLSMGSNIEPESNLRGRVDLLRQYGEVEAVSGMWESHAVGLGRAELPERVRAAHDQYRTGETEGTAGHRSHRVGAGPDRTEDKNASAAIDMDIMMVDGQAFNLDRWDNAFVLLPFAELLPDGQHPVRHETLAKCGGKSAPEHLDRGTIGAAEALGLDLQRARAPADIVQELLPRGGIGPKGTEESGGGHAGILFLYAAHHCA